MQKIYKPSDRPCPVEKNMPAPLLHIDSCKRLFEQFKLRKATLHFALVAVGSVLTDLEEMGVVKGLHWKAESFLAYLLKTDPKYAPLAIGMIMHEEMDRTLDTHYVEPNIPRAEKILKKFNSQMFANEGHYFLDHAMTCAFVSDNPGVVRIAERAKKRLKDKHLHKIAYHLSTFFGGDEQGILSALHHFKHFDMATYLSDEKTADMYGKFSLLRDGFSPDKRSTLDKIKLALRYLQFILSNKKYLILEATQHAKKEFRNHNHAYNLACTAMSKRFAKLHAKHHLSFKKFSKAL